MAGLEGRVALVTGGSRGIGRAVCVRLAHDGADVAINYANNAEAANEVAEEVRKLGRRAEVYQADVADEAAVNAMCEQAIADFGQIDILINNAGITRDALLLRMKDEDWDAVLTVNLKGAFLCSRSVAKVMSKQRYGRIINIASVVGQMGNAGQANYCASKAGLIGLTKSNARELAKRNVTVNAVAPGFIATAMTEALPEKVREELAAQIPLERLGSADDIANAVIFLAQEESGYITGQVIGVNGGMYM